jgi:hypothetical protein
MFRTPLPSHSLATDSISHQTTQKHLSTCHTSHTCHTSSISQWFSSIFSCDESVTARHSWSTTSPQSAPFEVNTVGVAIR